MANDKRKLMVFDGLKASLLWDENSDAWTYSSGGPTTPMQEYFKLIPTLFRGVNIIANSVSAMPFKIYKGKEEVDVSQEYQNKVGFLPKPKRTLSLTSMSLLLTGCAYFRIKKNQVGYPQIFYQTQPSVTPKIEAGILKEFERIENTQTVHIPVKDMIYLWLDDPFVELGPPAAFPGQAAFAASRVLGNMGAYVALYFERGAIRPVIVSVKGAPSPTERERMESWFQKLMGGIKRGFLWKVFNSDTVDIKQIGDGLDSLQDTELTASQRQDVAHALGIPYAILFSEAANNATAQADQLNLYGQTIVPHCEFIEDGLNEQLFVPNGYRLEFNPETLDIFQEDEESRAGALKQLTDARVPLLMAMDILGFEITDEQRAELEAAEKAKEEERQRMADMTSQAPKPNEIQPTEPTNNQPPQLQQANKALDDDLAKWKRKSLKALKDGKPACVPFESSEIPLRLGERIAGALKSAETAEAIENAFIIGDMLPDLAVELQKANEFLKRQEERILKWEE